MNRQGYENAIVVGAGIAGLLAARALSDHYSHVTVLERDVLPSESKPRAGVPQGYHLHALLPRGLQIMEAFFAGLNMEMQKAGAISIDTGADIAWLDTAGLGRSVECGASGNFLHTQLAGVHDPTKSTRSGKCVCQSIDGSDRSCANGFRRDLRSLHPQAWGRGGIPY